MALSSDLELDNVVRSGETHKWTWFKRYSSASRILKSLTDRTPLPTAFVTEVRKKIKELSGDETSYLYEDHRVFTHQHDKQLLQWFNR